MKKEASGRRDELLASIVDHLLQQGLAGASLRPIAAAIGTNGRMLIYHFNSRDELFAAAMAEARRRHLEALVGWAEQDRGSAKDGLVRFWSWASSRRVEPYVRLSIEAEILAAQGRVELKKLAAGMVGDWVDVIEGRLQANVPPLRRRAVATAVAAGFRGLLLDLAVTGERTRVNAAAHELAARMM